MFRCNLCIGSGKENLSYMFLILEGGKWSVWEHEYALAKKLTAMLVFPRYGLHLLPLPAPHQAAHSWTASYSARILAVGVLGWRLWQGATTYPLPLRKMRMFSATSRFTSSGVPKGRVC